MSAWVDRERDSLAPALIAALALHLGLFASLTLLRPTLPMPMGAAVPINIVSQAPAARPSQAEPAPRVQTAQAEQPVAAAPTPAPPPPPPSRPAPVPTPAPPLKPAPSLRPTPRPAAKPAPVTPAPASRDDAAFLDKLQATVARYTRAQPSRPASGLKGPTRAQTAPVVSQDAGQGVSQSDIEGLGQLLNRLWHKTCDASRVVNVTVRLSVDEDGQVSSADAGGRQNSSDPATSASAIRAIAAVHQGAPYAPAFRGKSFSIIFDASKACSSG